MDRKELAQRIFLVLLIAFCLCLVGVYVYRSKQVKIQPTTLPPAPQVTRKARVENGRLVLPPRTKTSGCENRGPLPDPECTPGDIDPKVTQENIHQTICVPGYTTSVRQVSEAEERRVYASYGIKVYKEAGTKVYEINGVRQKPFGKHEVDHHIPLELGGSNSKKNLTIEMAEPKPGFREKDGVEHHLHALVCREEISLVDAQVAIANDWTEVYKTMKHKRRRQ